MIEIGLRGVRKRFARPGGRDLTIFDNLDLNVGRGEILAIVGPSGGGKTTLLNILALLEPIDSGEICVSGESRSVQDSGRLSMGYLFQRDALLPWRTAMGNSLLGLECRGVLSSRSRLRARKYFDRFGLSGFEEAWPSTMSGGQRQRVALIQNLLFDPDILLLDEPFGSVDYQTKLLLEEELLGVIRPAEGRDGKTVVFVTHDIEEAIVLADRVLVLGFPGEGIVFEGCVPLQREERSPIEARQSEVMKELFREIWAILRSHAPGASSRAEALRQTAVRG